MVEMLPRLAKVRGATARWRGVGRGGLACTSCVVFAILASVSTGVAQTQPLAQPRAQLAQTQTGTPPKGQAPAARPDTALVDPVTPVAPPTPPLPSNPPAGAAPPTVLSPVAGSPAATATTPIGATVGPVAAASDEREPRAFYERWWFWTGVTAVAVTAVVIVATTAGSEPPKTDLGNWPAF